MVKVGNQLFTAEGPSAVRELAKIIRGVFLDLKFHDIPNSVAGGVASAAKLPGVRLLTLHATGGVTMMRAARAALRGVRNPPKLLAVTLLTSLDAREMRRVGLAGSLQHRAVRLARLAQESGMDGVVTSAHEARAIRRACGEDFIILVPGVRPSATARGDQTRIATPAEAIRAGANYIVVGRPITAARDPRSAADSILREIVVAHSRA